MLMKTPTSLSAELLLEFEAIVGYRPRLTADYCARFEVLARHLATQTLFSPEIRRTRLVAAINRKFDFNRDGVAHVFSRAASKNVVFNYHEKTAIQAAFDLNSKPGFLSAIEKTKKNADLHKALIATFTPVSESESLARLAEEISNPSKLRVAVGDRDIGNDIAIAAFSAFLFSATEPEILHAFFDKTYHKGTYENSYWKQLRRDFPSLYSRTRTLEILNISQSLMSGCCSLSDLEDTIFSQLRESYASLENHGHLAIWIAPVVLDSRLVHWELASDIMLFAEKHDEVQLKNAYFRNKQISSQTSTHIHEINEARANFDLANEGFTYRDTFVCPPAKDSQCGTESLLLIFQKNKRDETRIPCPACRSHEVQGNSYSSLGVRSWECCNPLCPDRSKYNRGKRYSFKALLMQEAIEEEKSQIPSESVRAWSRDVRVGRDYFDALEMLTRHYSLAGDGILLRLPPQPLQFNPSVISRRVYIENSMTKTTKELSKRFFESSWFERYAIPAQLIQPTVKRAAAHNKYSIDYLTIVHGDSAIELLDFPAGHFDAAVTSPPYFNARDYAQWPNIYCHMYDMQKIAMACFRVLKEGAFYLYNLFDYFDNEKSIVFSAMGDKRLILSAYTVDCFRRAGFELVGSVTWDKGEIEGKRAFNAGNFSPYYQAPFNCWEHVLVFRKPKSSTINSSSINSLPSVLRANPVIKIIRGENVLGHTAPFPIDIPNLLRELLPPGGRIIDPFGGSGTTARALKDYAAEVVCIERDKNYCDLALRLFKESMSNQGQSRLFA